MFLDPSWSSWDVELSQEGFGRTSHGKKHAAMGSCRATINIKIRRKTKAQSKGFADPMIPWQIWSCWKSHELTAEVSIISWLRRKKMNHNTSSFILQHQIYQCCEAQNLQNDRTRNVGASQVEMRYSTVWALQVKTRPKYMYTYIYVCVRKAN